jgi:endonuclease/exonuclease/phosphatase family metal-dependent hydrolase
MPPLTLRIMTLNLGGGVKNFTGSPETSAGKIEAINQLIDQIRPDLLGVQEIAQYIDADGIMHSMVHQIRDGNRFDQSYYGETLSIKKHLQIRKDLMIKAIFNDWWDWSKGNALFSKLPFSRLSDSSKTGVPRNLPIYQPLVYEGTRNTDPRYVILSRLKTAPFPYVLNLHLSTLVAERGENSWQDAMDAGRATRQQQMGKVLGLIEEHILRQQKPVILMGDFNAQPDEYSLQGMLEYENNFVRLTPNPDRDTHVHAGRLDHIYFFPRNRLCSYTCQVIDNELSHRVSDHLPVVANLEIE